jgi:mRNA-degrading endonuclease RelE of RelBE toxin-antitoxin system
MYAIIFTAQADTFMQKLSPAQRIAVAKKLTALQVNPFHYVQRLQGEKLWRLRVQDYRLILDIIVSGKKIIVVRIGHRKNAYD